MRNVFGREVADTWQPEALEPLPQEKPHPCNEKTQAPPTYGKVWERKLSTIFYNAGATSNSKYLKPAAGGCWVPTDENGVKRYLKMMAEPLAALPLRSPILTDYGRALEWVQCCNHIAYAGPLAGHKAGVHEINGERILVTNSPKLIEPVRGGWVTPDMLIRGLLVLKASALEGKTENLVRLYSWSGLPEAARILFKRKSSPRLWAAEKRTHTTSLLLKVLTSTRTSLRLSISSSATSLALRTARRELGFRKI
jgi:hypothetical protein